MCLSFRFHVLSSRLDPFETFFFRSFVSFAGISQAFHSAQCNNLLDCFGRHRRLRSAPLQSGHQMSASRSCVPMRLGRDGERNARAAADPN